MTMSADHGNPAPPREVPGPVCGHHREQERPARCCTNLLHKLARRFSVLAVKADTSCPTGDITTIDRGAIRRLLSDGPDRRSIPGPAGGWPAGIAVSGPCGRETVGPARVRSRSGSATGPDGSFGEEVREEYQGAANVAVLPEPRWTPERILAGRASRRLRP